MTRRLSGRSIMKKVPPVEVPEKGVTYVMLGTLPREVGVGPKALEEMNLEIEARGAKVLSHYPTMGRYDFANIVEAPDAETITRVEVEVFPRWRTRVEMLRKTPEVPTPPPSPPPPVDLGVYWERLRRLIPGEVTALYVAGTTVIPAEERLGQVTLVVWAIFCLLAVVLFMANQTRTEDSEAPLLKRLFGGADRKHVAISSVSFVIWVYALGGPFKILGLHVGFIGLLLMMGWTFIVPLFYAGPPPEVAGQTE